MNLTEESARQSDEQPDEPLYVFIEKARCPRKTCKNGRLVIYRSVANGDGSRTRLTRCSECGGRVFVVVEVPESGGGNQPGC